jgi:NADH dehydrogenase
VVVGAGFAGLAVVRGLEGADVNVTLVDRNIYSTFQPLLYQVATGGLNPGDVAHPLRNVTRRHRARFRRGTMVGIDRSRRCVLLAGGATLPYDHLVLATGVGPAWFGVPGAAEHTRNIYTRASALALRDELMGRLETLAEQGGDATVTVAVVGGGPTGVELAGTLAELRSNGLPAFYPEVAPARLHIVLVDQAAELLGPFEAGLRRYALDQLHARGVDVRLGAPIEEVRADALVLAGGERLPADLTVWAAGVSVPDSVASWGFTQGRGGRIVVGRDLQVPGQAGIHVAGDLALVEGLPLAQVAQPAIQMGTHIARQIVRALAGKPPEAFAYRDKGMMATIGRRSAVVELPNGIRARGTLAWLAWLALHIVTLLGNRNRISALLNLSWRYLAWPRGAGVIVGDTAPP